MLTSEPTPLPATLATRLIVEPRIRVRTSVLPAEDPERASAVCADSGVPLDVLARHGATVRQTHRRANVVVIDVPAERQDALRSDLAAAGFDARPPKPVFPLLNESVPAQHVPAIWRAGFEGAGLRIAIVDTGADRHPDFAGRIALAQDFTEHGDVDDVGHGTHVAGIAAGAGAVYRGVAPKATLVIAKALAGDGGSEDAVLAAMSWASRQNVDVMNLSLGGPGDPKDPLSREVDALWADGILVCVAAGNSGPGAKTIGSPGTAAGAITVGATDKRRALTSYSSRGPVPGLRVHKPDLVAIGGGVTPEAACHYGVGVASARASVLDRDRCAVPPRYVRMSGTSMATPHVTGLCAVLLEAAEKLVGEADIERGVARAGGPPPATKETTKIAKARAVRRALVQGAVDLGLAPDAAGAGIVDGERSLAALRRSRARTSASDAASRSGVKAK